MTERRDTLPFLMLVPNMVTILGLCAGTSAIRYTFDGRFELAVGLIIFAAVIDGLDGLIARRLRATSEIGAQLDSLSDFVCFGVVPAVVVYHFAMTDAAGFGWIFALVFAICCCLRLARFNVMREQPDAPKHFIGVPAPAGAALALMPMFATFADLVDVRTMGVPVALWLGLVGVLMVSRLPTPSLKGVRVPRAYAPYLLVAIALVVGLMLNSFWLLLVVVGLGYCGVLAVGALNSLRRKR